MAKDKTKVVAPQPKTIKDATNDEIKLEIFDDEQRLKFLNEKISQLYRELHSRSVAQT